MGTAPPAIAARDLAVHLGAIGLGPFALDAPILDTFGGRADLALRLQRDAPRPPAGVGGALPCPPRLGWSFRASMSSSASLSLASSAQRSRQRSTISVRFQSRILGP